MNPASASRQITPLPLVNLVPHPANPNAMTDEQLQKLALNIERTGNYPPLIVRPHPERTGDYEVLDGHQRIEVLRRRGEREAFCVVWECDDQEALLLLSTLNRLTGEDHPRRRAELLRELGIRLPVTSLERLLPESPAKIAATLRACVDGDALSRGLADATQRASQGPRIFSFSVAPHEQALVEGAIRAAAGVGEGQLPRGSALAAICRVYLEARSGG